MRHNLAFHKRWRTVHRERTYLCTPVIHPLETFMKPYHYPDRSNRRGGYALILVMMVSAICGLAIAGIAHSVRYETLELKARRDSVARRHLDSRNASVAGSEKAKAKEAMASQN